jgi:hypothetical protein
MSDDDQEMTSKWLADHGDFSEVNFYFYQGETNVSWLLYALSRADITLLNYDSDHVIINLMGSYILSRPNVHYTTENTNLKELMVHINNKFVPNTERFLEMVFNDQGK